MMADLLMFHGRECPHCKKMMPLVEKLEQESGVRIDKREVWHDEKNADLMRSYRSALAPKCGGQLRVPTFFNPDTQDAICGEVEFEKLKEWALKR
ncbi:MAG: thioredoxin family protein [Candidatus Aminicenantes bacterium]|nr:thioredoxin family protein [Candidatus Aminicenantes bacterium]